ncbi:keratin, type I cytoskeletal 12-like [Bombina bombina]|uniref:keratin, type I cytoskeletal 12-like n=1 Tax=Bombina bombina TaxID=8345 RepID=UPI00235AD62D|nr:keratin, type I cytoskeletal 12-like [Bombina bombina]
MLISSMSFTNELSACYAKTRRFREVGSRLRYENGMHNGGLYCPSQKNALINLNDRLAAYLEKVSKLEESNRQLEQQIQNLTEKKAKHVKDNSRYEKTIAELESQVKKAKVINAELCLNIENVKLTAGAFKEKYEAERSVHQTIRSEVKDMKNAVQNLESDRARLEVDVRILIEELNGIRKDHKEELEKFHACARGFVNVEMDSLQETDLTRALEEIRANYWAITERHCRDMETWFLYKSKESIIQNRSRTESLQMQNREVAKLKGALQDLEIKLEVLHNMKFTQEVTLSETEASFNFQLQNIKELVSRREQELAKIRKEMEHLVSDSRILHYLKDLLEMEIKTYGMLMDEEEIILEEVKSEATYRTAQQLSKSKQKSSSVITKQPPVLQDLKKEDSKISQKTEGK